MCLTCAATFLPGISASPGPARPARGALPAAAADHHLHIQGPDVTAELRRRRDAAPQAFAIFNPALFETRTGADALAALDAAGIAQGVLLSMAYTFASPRSTAAPSEVAALTHRENRFNVDAAAASGGRLAAFIGVNPLWDGALDELRSWSREPGVHGVKLHLSNSGFDASSGAHVERLAAAFAFARAASWPLVVHARGDGDYTPAETHALIEQVLPHAGDVVVQVAHGGGGGGIDDGLVTALALYADAIERGAPGTRHLAFDLSVVLVRDPADPAQAALLARFVELARRIGLHRFLVASDWPSLVPPREHDELSTAQLAFTDDEWRQLRARRAAYLPALAA